MRTGRLERARSKLGASWNKGSKLEQAGRLERAGSKLGVSWSNGSELE